MHASIAALNITKQNKTERALTEHTLLRNPGLCNVRDKNVL